MARPKKGAPNKNHDYGVKRRASRERMDDSGLDPRIGELGLTSLSSALPARAAPEGRLVFRHSALVRVCHWVNAICFVVLLMSGMQIFNASPLADLGADDQFREALLLALGRRMTRMEMRRRA